MVDLSCGSGLFARKFAQSGNVAGVVASGFSESMPDQAAQYLSADYKSAGSVLLLRADVARLPFAMGSEAAIFAGALLLQISCLHDEAMLQPAKIELSACMHHSRPSQQQAFTTCCSRLHAKHHLQLNDRTVTTSDSKRCGGNASSSCARRNHQNLHAALG